MSAALADMTPGFRDAVHGAQLTFRSVLNAMARPGLIAELPAAAVEGIVPPASSDDLQPMGLASTALMLALLDAECGVRLVGRLASAAAVAYLRFHTGVSAVGETADFTLARAGDVDAQLWSRLHLGSDNEPQRGATLVIEVSGLGRAAGTRLQLRGPGIQDVQPLMVSGLSHEFWLWRQCLQAALPRGIDLILVEGVRVAAVPRSSRITLEA